MNVWGIGRNYGEHAKELGNAVPTTPLVFLKAGSTVVPSGKNFSLPEFSHDIHHELELAVEFGSDLEIRRACVALDLTARDIQNTLKENRHPWTLAKSFKNACPVGNFFEKKSINLDDLDLELVINGKLRQKGHTKDMIFKVNQLVEYVKEHFPVCPGDLILTGTPQGVAALHPGDKVEAFVKSQGQILSQGSWTILSK